MGSSSCIVGAALPEQQVHFSLGSGVLRCLRAACLIKWHCMRQTELLVALLRFLCAAMPLILQDTEAPSVVRHRCERQRSDARCLK